MTNATNGTAPSTALPLFYKTAIPLDSARHGRLHMRQPRSYTYAAHTAVVPVVADEMGRLAGTYPLLFRTGPQPMMLAVLGIRPNENLFVDADGRWRSRVPVPAYVNRYPFILLETGSDKLALGFDETCDLFTDSGTQPLFDGTKPSKMLEDVLKMCAHMKVQADIIMAFTAAVAEHDLLVEQRAELVVGKDQRTSLVGFSVINERKFMELPDAVWLEWKKKGWIGLVYAHLLSIERLSGLTAIAEERM